MSKSELDKFIRRKVEEGLQTGDWGLVIASIQSRVATELDRHTAEKVREAEARQYEKVRALSDKVHVNLGEACGICLKGVEHHTCYSMLSATLAALSPEQGENIGATKGRTNQGHAQQ